MENACQVWAAVDLPRLQAQMDEDANEIQANQGKSLQSRRELASKTKQFKSLNDDSKLDQLNQLLKSYQLEIDSLNKRNKLVESSFFKIYRGISEVPDPNPLLQNSTNDPKVQQLETENSLLQSKLLKFADYDTIKDKIKQNSDDFKISLEKKLKLNDDKWKSIIEEKEMNWLKDQGKFSSTIDNLKSKLQESSINEKMLKKKLKNNEIHFNDVDDNDDIDQHDIIIDDQDNNSIELNLLKKDFEELKLNSNILKKRNEDLRIELINANSKSDLEIQNFKHSQRNEHSDLESEIALISAKLEHERLLNSNSQLKINQIESSSKIQLDNLNTEIENLRIFKQQTGDYNEIKRELEILKQIQFGDDEDENQNGDENQNNKSNAIDSVIVQRNRKLNDDLVDLRNKSQILQNQLSDSNSKISQLTIELQKFKSINNDLENELMNFNTSNSRGNNMDKWETMSMVSSIAPTPTNGGNQRHSLTISPAASIAGGLNEGSIIQGGGISTGGGGGDSTLLPIITQQRDRFRSRNRELEDENKKHFSKLIEMKREVNSLKNDNKELFEKIQFLKFHNNNNSNVNKNNTNSSIDQRYEEDYEKQLHPIEKFRLMETRRISSKISPWERVFIQITKTVLSTQYTRWLFVGYCFTLHLLVMLLSMYLIGSTPEPIVSQSTINSATGGKSG